MSIFLETRMKSTNNNGHAYRGTLAKVKSKPTFVCQKCKKTLPSRYASIEHKIPRVIVKAGSLTLNNNCTIYCLECNNKGSVIPGHIGVILSSGVLTEIKSASRILCNTVRPVKKGKNE